MYINLQSYVLLLIPRRAFLWTLRMPPTPAAQLLHLRPRTWDEIHQEYLYFELCSNSPFNLSIFILNIETRVAKSHDREQIFGLDYRQSIPSVFGSIDRNSMIVTYCSMTTRIFNSNMISESINRRGGLLLATLIETAD